MSDDVSRIFIEAKALLEGHFLLTSGRHGGQYLEKFQVLQNPSATERLCRMIADRFRDERPSVVVGPTTGGIIVAYEVARQLGLRGIFAESDGPGRTLKRGFRIEPGERTLVVDDVLTTGGSIHEVLAVVQQHGGIPVGIGVLVDRSQGKVDFGVPLYGCYTLNVPSYEAEACPLCKQGVPLVTPH
ncbi:MAG: orotate phosphoribosyltransferase [Chloroflexi bacterium]|nr:orotate phosphoribosyltransferase [Chloroflexota bacterium]